MPYNPNNGGTGSVTSVSVTAANGVTGAVATPTTTPAISLTLGAITPASVAATGALSGASETLTGLLDISAAGAGQVKFPSTQNASANANTLDDYSEGTWTPTDGSGAGLSFSLVAANYTKIGRSVTVTGTLNYPSTASGLSAAISGLPYASQNVNFCSAAGIVYAANLTETPVCQIGQNSSKINLLNSLTGAQLTNANLSAQEISFSLTYFSAN